MAKRFTDTGKWKRPWFQGLSRDAKLLWIFLCDDCDHVGIWIADFELMSLRLGMRVDEARLKELVGDKLVKIDADKYFIPSFFTFQYGEAKDGFKAKQSAIKTLRFWNLVDESDSLKDFTNSYLSVQVLSMDCPSISISKIKIISNSGSAEGEVEALYRGYPRKQGKSDGFKRLVADLNAGALATDMVKARDNYIAYLKRDNVEAKYIQLFSTWANKWRDWLDPSHGTSENYAKNNSGYDWEKYEREKTEQGAL
jgi:hypothetical protein